MHMLEVPQTLEISRRLKGLKDDRAVSYIDVRIKRLALCNLGDVKGHGDGVCELRIHHGPVCWVYFMQRGERIIYPGAPGSTTRQARIEKSRWRPLHSQLFGASEAFRGSVFPCGSCARAGRTNHLVRARDFGGSSVGLLCSLSGIIPASMNFHTTETVNAKRHMACQHVKIAVKVKHRRAHA